MPVKDNINWISGLFSSNEGRPPQTFLPQNSKSTIPNPKPHNPRCNAPPPPRPAPPRRRRGRCRAGDCLPVRRQRPKRCLHAPARRRPLLPCRLHGSLSALDTASPHCCSSCGPKPALAQFPGGWLSQIGFVVADYKYSLRGLDSGSADYRVKLSEVWICPDAT